MFLQAFAFTIAAGYSVLFAARSPAATGPLVLAVAVTALIGVPLGLALAALLPRELPRRANAGPGLTLAPG